MIIRRMTKEQAAEFVAEVDAQSDDSFEETRLRWKRREVDNIPIEYLELRDKIVSIFDENSSRGDYVIDLSVGLELYRLLDPLGEFSLINASDDDFWRYLSCTIFPDLTYERYPKPSKGDIRLNRKRFYAHTKRIWLKTLWLYIHLSWQGNEKKTRKVLERCGADTIGQLIERTGKGYRLPLYRAMMKAYSKCENPNAALFKKLQAQNTVDCRVIEPALMEDGEKGYINYLFKQLDR